MKSKQPETVQQEVLSGWKEIANHLGRGVRTVQRYERDLGLPVRRPSGHPTGAVVAVKSELDSWVRSSATAQESFNKAQRSLNAQQESFNRAQDSINVAQESLNAVQKSLNVTQEFFNKETRFAEGRLVSEVAKGLQDRSDLQAQMTELRKELRMSVSKVRENVSKLRQQLNEMRQRHESIASLIKDHSKRRALLSVSGKRQKPN